MKGESNQKRSSGREREIKISNSRAMGVIVLIALLFVFQVVTFVWHKAQSARLADGVALGEVAVVDGAGKGIVGGGGTSAASGDWTRSGDVPAGGASGTGVRSMIAPSGAVSGGRNRFARGKRFPFDPNSISSDSLQLLGFSARQAQSILKYRAKGGKFRWKEDFSKLYVVDSAVYAALEEYIALPHRGSGTKGARNVPGGDGVGTNKGVFVPEGGINADMGTKLSQNVPKLPNDVGTGTKSARNVPGEGKNVNSGTEDGKNVPKVQENAGPGTERGQNVPATADSSGRRAVGADLLASGGSSQDLSGSSGSNRNLSGRTESIYGKKVERKRYMCNLNTADSVALVQLYGIGGYYARKILQYREKLGGSFVDIRQLLEIEGFTQERFAQIEKNVFVRNEDVKGFSILKAERKALEQHPYIGRYAARGIVTYLKLKGANSFENEIKLLQELVKEKIISEGNAQKLREYLLHL